MNKRHNEISRKDQILTGIAILIFVAALSYSGSADAISGTKPPPNIAWYQYIPFTDGSVWGGPHSGPYF